MTTSFDPKQTGLSTQDLPIIPTVEVMQAWGREEVLQWIQQRNSTILQDDELENFNKAHIMGMAFLDSDVKFYRKTCGLSPGVGLALKHLADEVKEGKLSNQTAGRKRKADEIDAPEPPISKNINLQQDYLLELATRANERRKRIKEIITDINGSSDQHSNSVEPANPLPGAVDQLSDPTFKHTLPFPFVGSEAPIRFNVVEGNWEYVGRTKFKELLQEFKMVQRSEGYTTLWLYGTQGYGKSHLLAALVCYLAAQDERVVYISDCRALLDDSVEYLLAAMLFAWADDIATQNIIMALSTLKEIRKFFKSNKNIIFVMDQMNALKNDGSSEKEKRQKLSDWIRRFTYRHKKVYSSSANNADYHKRTQNQNQNKLLPVYGGLTETEMGQWWERHSDIDMGGYERRDVEDVTGRIPLLLNKCVVGTKIDLTVQDLRDIYDKAVGFAQQVKERNTPPRWKWYYDYVTACFRHKTTPYGRDAHLDLIDHRYFYELDNKGWYTCSLIRDAVGDQLLTWNEDFADTDFLTSLPDFIDNRSVAGFMIEHAVLSSIRSNGLAIGAGIKKAMEVRLLTDLSDINTDITGTAVLYRPKKFNFKAIDGIIILIKPNEKNTKKKLLMFPLQITLAPADHANSREQFFDEYDWWIDNLSNFDVEIQFLWITPECRDSQKYPASLDPKWPKHLERYIPLQNVNQGIWEKYEYAQKKLLKTEATQRKLQKTKGSSIKAVPERAPSERAAAIKAASEIAASERAASERAASEGAAAEKATVKVAAKKKAAKKKTVKKSC